MPKFRHEFKYVISSAELVMLKHRMMNLLSPDPHAGSDGRYNIRSLYFDDYYNSCFYDNENGTDPRQKYRIRIYNNSTERITLECKRKERGKTLKTSCPLTLEETKLLMEGKPFECTPERPPLLKQFLSDISQRGFRPVVIVDYNRTPYVCKNGNVRVTLDTEVSSCKDIGTFFDEVIPKRPIMPAGQHLLEVKFDEYLPDYIYDSLQLQNLRQTAYSKYYLCRKFTL